MRERGTVKSWDDEKAFGWIVTTDMPDIFVHLRQLIGAASLTVGDRVEYVR